VQRKTPFDALPTYILRAIWYLVPMSSCLLLSCLLAEEASPPSNTDPPPTRAPRPQAAGRATCCHMLPQTTQLQLLAWLLAHRPNRVPTGGVQLLACRVQRAGARVVIMRSQARSSPGARTGPAPGGFRLSAFGFRLSAFGFRLSAFGFRLSAFTGCPRLAVPCAAIYSWSKR
jgi:hypothetical protein